MKFFLDTADVAEIKSLVDSGLLDGVTTNPSLVAKAGRQMRDIIAEICAIVPGPVSAEVAATDFDGIMREGRVLREIARNVTVKVPLTADGLRACRKLSDDGYDGERDAVLLSRTGAAGSQSRRHLRQSVRRSVG